MKLLIVDLTGPMSLETLSGKSYAFMAVEASSRFGAGKLMVTKDETVEILKTTVARLECQSGFKLKCLHSDNGTEFVNVITRAQWDHP